MPPGVIWLPMPGTLGSIRPRSRIFSPPAKPGFFGLHGFDPLKLAGLDAALREHPLRNSVESVIPPPSHGVKCTVRCSIASPDRRNPRTLTVWMIDDGQTIPRFVSGYASPAPPPAFPKLP
jgi:hypothetical protein